MDSGVKPGQALPRTNWTSSPTVRRLCVRSSSSGSSACSGSACPADVRSVAPLLSPAVESGLRARSVCAETAQWLRGDVSGGGVTSLGRPLGARWRRSPSLRPRPGCRPGRSQTLAPWAPRTARGGAGGGRGAMAGVAWRAAGSSASPWRSWLVRFHPKPAASGSFPVQPTTSRRLALSLQSYSGIRNRED